MSDVLLHLTQQQLVELAQEALERHVSPASKYRDFLHLAGNLKDLPSATEMEREILDLPLNISHEQEGEVYAEVDSRAARLFGRELESRFDDYQGFASATTDGLKDEFLEDFAAALITWKNYRLADQDFIQIDSWWETARSMKVAAQARSTVMRHLSPEQAAPWLDKAPAFGLHWDVLWNDWKSLALQRSWTSALTWAPFVLEAKPVSLEAIERMAGTVPARQSPAAFKQGVVEDFYGAVVVAEARETNQKDARALSKLQECLRPHLTPSLEDIHWGALLESNPSNRQAFAERVVSPEEFARRLVRVFERLAPSIDAWVRAPGGLTAPALGELRVSSGKNEVSLPAILRWVGKASPTTGEITLSSLQALMDAMDRVCDTGPLYRNALEASLLETKLDSAAPVRSKPRL